MYICCCCTYSYYGQFARTPRHCYVCTNNSMLQQPEAAAAAAGAAIHSVVSSCWYSRNRNSSESRLCCCSRFYTCTSTRYLVRIVGMSTNCRCNTYEDQIRGILLSPTWYIRLQHWYQVPRCIRVRSMLDMILLSEIAPMRRNTERCHVSRKSKAPAAGLNAFANYATSASISQMILR